MNGIRILVARVRDIWGFWRLQGHDGRPTSLLRAWELARVLNPWGR